ncbi:MAG: helix-turn-helix domain-containing protein [Clostridia bacterium]|nr:helix-turn-helix domain-containing protein [Clostridia bacterium]
MAVPVEKVRAFDWGEVPLVLTIEDLQRALGIPRHQAYALAHRVGKKLGKRLLVARESLRRFLES